MVRHTILFVLLLTTPARAAVDAENPRKSEAAPADETPGSFFARPATSPTVEPTPAARARRTAIYVVEGLGTPVGISGFEGVRRVGQMFEIAAGFGGGLVALSSQPHATPGHILQWSAMPRLRLGDDHSAFIAGAGVSGGNYGNFPLCFDGPCPTTYPVSYFLWSNFEAGGEWWWSNGFALRLFGGYAHGWCVSSTCVSGTTNLPYVGFGIGYAF